MPHSIDKKKLIEKIYLLESSLGNKYSHTILEPFKFNSADAVEVQKAGKKLSEFIGVSGLIFVISYSTQKERVGGHIELNKGNEVFIEIESNFSSNCEIVLAILAHEICHKYLHLNNIELLPEIENEILTDVATVYTGLGKLSLNGCETTNSSTETIGKTATTTTTTNLIGYLDRNKFAFVYNVICEMRRVQRPKMISSLNDEAVKAVSVIPQNDTFYLNHKYFDSDSLPTSILEQLQCETNESQIEFSRFSKNIRLVEEAVLVEANRLRLDFHNFNKQTIEKILYKIRQTPSKDSQNYIRNLLTIIELEFIRDEASAKTRKISSLNKALSQLIKDTTTNYPDLSKIKKGDFLFIFSCPLCTCKMRIKEKKLAKVKCSKCEYQFIVDTRVEESSSKKLRVGKRIQEISTKTQKAFNKLLIKIRSVFP